MGEHRTEPPVPHCSSDGDAHGARAFAAPAGEASREVEVKAVVGDWSACIARAREAGAEQVYAGRLTDRRYDSSNRSLAARDEMLRVRLYDDARPPRAQLAWKGPTRYEHGYKVREEIETDALDGTALVFLLERLGYVVVREIEREIAQFRLAGAVVRFERYPRMDDLVEVEGTPDAIERAVAALGMPRSAFTNERLRAFMDRYRARTELEPALSTAELEGRARYDESDV